MKPIRTCIPILFSVNSTDFIATTVLKGVLMGRLDYVSKEAKFQDRDLMIARAYADEHTDSFDDGFLTSLEAQFASKGYLSDKQYSALQNIIERWKMEEWLGENGENI